MGVPCCRMSVAPGREWVARVRRWVADGSRAVAPSRGDVAAMSPGVARLSSECRGLSRWCRGGVAAVAEVFFSVKPATVTNIMTEWGGLGRCSAAGEIDAAGRRAEAAVGVRSGCI